MDVLIDRVAGLDVHKDKVTAAVRLPDGSGGRRTEVREFRTFTSTLRDLLVWLSSFHVTVVAMEATGVYWIPVWDVLADGDCELQLCNAQHVKNVPGKKTDVNDAVWLAQLTECGLLQPSFVPTPEVGRWRDLTRYRTKLVQERTSEISRLQKQLEKAGIKLDSVVSNIVGLSSRDMLAELIAGRDDPAKLAQLARGRMRPKVAELALALEGRFDDHHRLMVSTYLAHIDRVTEMIADIDAKLETAMLPYVTILERLETIPGIGRRIAQIILAEMGPDISRFPTPAQFAAWAGLCPGNNESAGKRRRAPARKGNKYLRTALCQAATVAVKSKGSYLHALYVRNLRQHGGKQKGKAVFNVAHSMLVSIWHMQARQEDWTDPGADYFTRLESPEARIARLTRQLEALGQTVVVTPNAA